LNWIYALNELTNLDMELDPYLNRMLNAYGNIPARNPDSARRTRDKFLTEINNVLLEPTISRTIKRSVVRRSLLMAWILSLTRLKKTFVMTFGRRAFAMLMVLIAFFFGGTGITAYAAASALPGDVTYSIKTTTENVYAMLLFDPASQVHLYLEYAGRRLSEIQSLIDRGRYTDVASAAGEFEADIRKALSAIESLSQTDPALAAILSAEIAEILDGYASTLSQMLVVIPDDLQSAILSALQVSQSNGDHDGDMDDDGNDDLSTPLPALVVSPTSEPDVDDDADNGDESPTVSPTGISDDFLASTPAIPVTDPPFVLSTATPEIVSIAPANPVIEGEDAACEGSLGAVTVNNLRVPQGASCVLEGTTVKGTIKVENAASLIARGVTVVGNIQAEGARHVEVIFGSSVGGSIQVKQGGGAWIEGVSVNGDIQLESNNGTFNILTNMVGGNIQIFQNAGIATVANNVVNGNLQCKENDPAPTGGSNTVDGNKEDQCAGL